MWPTTDASTMTSRAHPCQCLNCHGVKTFQRSATYMTRIGDATSVMDAMSSMICCEPCDVLLCSVPSTSSIARRLAPRVWGVNTNVCLRLLSFTSNFPLVISPPHALHGTSKPYVEVIAPQAQALIKAVSMVHLCFRCGWRK
jgi:hypothetical protein